MKDTVDSSKQVVSTGRGGSVDQVVIDLDLEATDPLAKHEITLQFAAFRAPTIGVGDAAGGGRTGDASSGRERGWTVPTSVYFTYQFYTCRPTRTERMVLRLDAPKDRLFQVRCASGVDYVRRSTLLLIPLHIVWLSLT